jgi:GNAT superfamily N-acetyltransferase
MFELTESRIAEILFAMENQNDEFALVADADKFSIVSFSQIDFSDSDSSGSKINPENVYSLPKWFSSDGFNLLEEFAEGLSEGPAKSELKAVLANGRGVFKNFKNVVRHHSGLENRFRLFKERKMKARILEWYASLREGWGLEKLESGFLESDLILEDFSFREYDFSTDGNCVLEESGKISDELKEENPGDLGLLFADLWSEKQNQGFEASRGFVCRTLSEEFAGCVLYRVDSRCPTVARESVTLTTCFVNKNYRGLGIARKLVSACVSDLRKSGFSTFFMADALISESFERILTDLGFEKIRSAYVARF